MQKFFITLLLLFCAVLGGFAQQGQGSFIKGQVVDPNGDLL